MSEDRDTEQVSSTWLAQLRREYVIYGSECARLQKDLDSTKRMFENAVMTIVTIGEAAGVRGEDQQNGHLEIVEAINKIKGRRAVYKAKATELERELEVWRSGPVCWSCGDSGEVHSLDGEWRGECNCQGAVDARRIAELTAELAESRKCAEIMQQGAFAYQAELAAIKAREPVAIEFRQFMTSVVTGAGLLSCGKQSKGLAAELSATAYKYLLGEPVYEAKAQGVIDFVFSGELPNATFVEVEDGNGNSINVGEWFKRDDGYSVLRLTAAPVQQVSVPDGWRELLRDIEQFFEGAGVSPGPDIELRMAAMLAAPAADAGLVEALKQAFPLFDEDGLNELYHHCEIAVLGDRKRLHKLLAAHSSKGVV